MISRENNSGKETAEVKTVLRKSEKKILPRSVHTNALKFV